MLGQIFVSFFKIGLFTFGGGYAMLPLAEEELVKKRNWVTEPELIDFYSVAQVSIGIIAINTSTLIGYKVAKRKGALVAAFAAALPSIIIISIITAFFLVYMNHPLVLSAFAMIRVAVTGIIAVTVFNLLKNIKNDYGALFIYGLSFVLVAFFKVSQVIILPLALVGGFLYSYYWRKK